MNAKLILNNKEYTVNFDKLLALGVIEDLKENKEEDHFSFSIGDVFEHVGGFVKVLIIGCNGLWGNDKNQKYQILGINGLEPYADFENPISYEEMKSFLQEKRYKWIKNINNDVRGLIEV